MNIAIPLGILFAGWEVDHELNGEPYVIIRFNTNYVKNLAKMSCVVFLLVNTSTKKS